MSLIRTGRVSCSQSSVMHGLIALPHCHYRVDKYGSTFVYGGFLGQRRLYLTDPKALAHVLVHRAVSYNWYLASRSLQ